jgi:hypothetical protein
MAAGHGNTGCRSDLTFSRKSLVLLQPQNLRPRGSDAFAGSGVAVYDRLLHAYTQCADGPGTVVRFSCTNGFILYINAGIVWSNIKLFHVTRSCKITINRFFITTLNNEGPKYSVPILCVA